MAELSSTESPLTIRNCNFGIVDEVDPKVVYGLRLGIKLTTCSNFDIRGNQTELYGQMAGGFAFVGCDNIEVASYYSGAPPRRNEFRYYDDLSHYYTSYQAVDVYSHLGGGLHHFPPSAIAASECSNLQIGSVHCDASYMSGLTNPIGGQGITLLNCPGTFLFENYLERLDNGMHLMGDFMPDGEGDLYLLQGNAFDNCLIGMDIDATDNPDDAELLSMHCNEFLLDETPIGYSIGIWIKALAYKTQIGSNAMDGSGNFINLAGNVFPPKNYSNRTHLPGGIYGNDVQLAWYYPSLSFQAIRNDGGYDLDYYRYVNEYVGIVNFGSDVIVFPNPTTSSTVDWEDYLAYTDANLTIPSSGVQVCNNLDPAAYYFPSKMRGGKDDPTFVTERDKFGLTLYPNPAENYFVIHSTQYEKPLRMRLISLEGKEVKSYIGVRNDEKLDLSGVPSGMYTVRVEGDAFVKTFKLSKLGND